MALLGSPLLYTLSGCGGNGGGGTAGVYGEVVDDGTELAVAGAAVNIGQRAKAQTDAEGRFALPNAPAGERLLIVMAEGYDPFALVLAKRADWIEQVRVRPTLYRHRGAVTGTVVRRYEGPVKGAQVRCGKLWAVSRSDGTGRFTLYNVPAGSRRISIFGDSLPGLEQMVSVDAGATVDIGEVVFPPQGDHVAKPWIVVPGRRRG